MIVNRVPWTNRLRYSLFLCTVLWVTVMAAWGQETLGEAPRLNLLDAQNAPFIEPDWNSDVPTPEFWNNDMIVGYSEHSLVDVPEPLLFDLVRPLGARKGELEFNTLAVFPWSSSNTNLENDPVGSGPSTIDRKQIEWAPEVEYALADGFAIEFELPFEGSTLELYKLGLQWTIGTAFDNRYIHGFQMLIQPTTDWEQWNTTLLYLGGIRFDETWSALIMLGGRMNLEGPNNHESFERVINASLFADVSEVSKIGLETNYASKVDGTSEFVLVPQFHYQASQYFQIQTGLGFGVFSEGSEQSFILRVVWSK